MKKLDVTKFVILGMLSIGLIACGTPSSDSSSTSTGSDTGDSLKSGGKCSEGGGTRSLAEGGGTKCAKATPVAEGGGTSPLPADEGGGTIALASNSSEVTFKDIGAEFVADNAIKFHGTLSAHADFVSFVINGSEAYQIAVNPDLSFEMEIGVTDEDKKEMIVDFVAGDAVQTFVMLDGNIEFHQF